jgi:hypothetical protein
MRSSAVHTHKAACHAYIHLNFCCSITRSHHANKLLALPAGDCLLSTCVCTLLAHPAAPNAPGYCWSTCSEGFGEWPGGLRASWQTGAHGSGRNTLSALLVVSRGSVRVAALRLQRATMSVRMHAPSHPPAAYWYCNGQGLPPVGSEGVRNGPAGLLALHMLHADMMPPSCHSRPSLTFQAVTG